MTKIKGKIIPGYGVASGKGKDERYPEGTLRMQYDHFKKRGLDLGGYFLGTLNVDIAPYSFEIKKPKYFFEAIKWSSHIPPENFYFFDVTLFVEGKDYDGLIYMPGPETKVEHEQIPTVLELILPRVEGLITGQSVNLEIKEEYLEVSKIG